MEKKKIAQAMSEKLEYICLDLEQIPETLKYVENINFKPNIGIEENKYRQYRFVSPKELEILLSPCNRLEDTKTKYSKAKPLVSYLEPKTEEEKELVRTAVKENPVFHYVFTHTCPISREPTHLFLNNIDQNKVDKSTELFLEEIYQQIDYYALGEWFCGHYHDDAWLGGRIHMLFNEYYPLLQKGEKND